MGEPGRKGLTYRPERRVHQAGPSAEAERREELRRGGCGGLTADREGHRPGPERRPVRRDTPPRSRCTPPGRLLLIPGLLQLQHLSRRKHPDLENGWHGLTLETRRQTTAVPRLTVRSKTIVRPWRWSSIGRSPVFVIRNVIGTGAPTATLGGTTISTFMESGCPPAAAASARGRGTSKRRERSQLRLDVRDRTSMRGWFHSTPQDAHQRHIAAGALPAEDGGAAIAQVHARRHQRLTDRAA